MMRARTGMAAILAALAAAGGAAHADDAYCDHARAVAAADAATLVAPEVFTSLGYVEQPVTVDIPSGSSDDVRFTLGVRYSLGDLYEGAIVRKRAGADCRRHRALTRLQAAPAQRALAARVKVLDEALDEAAAMLADAGADMASRRATAQEVMATRLRVDQLRAQAAAAHRELDAVPGGSEASLTGALADFHAADAEVERHDGRLRAARGWDISVRAGYDKFLAADEDESPYFAVVSASWNLGWLLQQPANRRALKARRRMIVDEPGATAAPALRALLASETRRAAESGVLVEDLEKQLDALRRIGGDDSRRFRQTVWFEWVEARAEHAYLEAHVASLREVLGEHGGEEREP